jgi:hypothetical protein
VVAVFVLRVLQPAAANVLPAERRDVGAPAADVEQEREREIRLRADRVPGDVLLHVRNRPGIEPGRPPPEGLDVARRVGRNVAGPHPEGEDPPNRLDPGIGGVAFIGASITQDLDMLRPHAGEREIAELRLRTQLRGRLEGRFENAPAYQLGARIDVHV